MDRRIAPPAGSEFDLLLSQLTNPQAQQQDAALFRTNQKALMFAAALGYHLGKRTPLPRRNTATAIRFDIFERAVDDGFVNSLAVAHTSDSLVLSDERAEERATIFEEFAHTGLLEIKRKCFEREGNPLDVLLELGERAREPASEDADGLTADLLREITR